MGVENDYELIVVGAGPAGLTAGTFGARSGLKTLVLDKGICGGLSNEATMIDNYPGFRNIGGMELAEKMKEQTADYADIKELEGVARIERGTEGKEMQVLTEKGSYLASTVVLCTGTKKRKLGVKGEDEFLGRGVSYCATCDGFFFKDKSVIVVGGGNSAVRGALYLQNLGCVVTLLHRRDELRAERYLQKGLERAGVRILWNSVLREIKGDKAVSSVVRYDKASANEDEIAADGVFIYAGEEPANSLATQLGVNLDENGFILTDKSQRTNLDRIYAAGDVTGGVRQIIVACAEGAIAATSAYEDFATLR